MRGDRGERRGRRPARQGGASALELAVGLPVLLLFGLAIVQLGLIYQARSSVEYAVLEAARRASVAHADMQAARQGLARGLAPWRFGANNAADLHAAELESLAHVERGLAEGWIELERRSPTPASFDDWAEPARDAFGDPIAGVVEIPNDNLDGRRSRTQPVGGIGGYRQAEPIGARSGQTLAESNQLRLHVVYGMRLFVPLAGPAIVATLKRVKGCGSGQGADVGAPVESGSVTNRRSCALLLASPPRLALSAAATARMMSTARRSADAELGAEAGGRTVGRASGAALGDGKRSEPTEAAEAAGTAEAGSEAGREAADSSPSLDRPTASRSAPTGLADGFLLIGSDRSYPAPSPHPALCEG